METIKPQRTLNVEVKAIQILDHPLNILGESPLWGNGMLYWIDIVAKRIFRWIESTHKIEYWQMSELIGSIALCDPSYSSFELMVALESGIYLVNLKSNGKYEKTHLVTPAGEPNPKTRFNDGKVSPDGRFFVGTMDKALSDPIGRLYRIDHDGSSHLVKQGFIVSNGLAWSPDGTHLYHSCSIQKTIWKHPYDVKTGEIGPGEILAQPQQGDGRPDGAAMDSEGYYWSAGVSDGCLNRFSSDGVLFEKYILPCKHPTMVCFGGEDLQTLYVTSLTEDKVSEEDFERFPASGKLFKMRAPVTGAAIPRFYLRSK